MSPATLRHPKSSIVLAPLRGLKFFQNVFLNDLGHNVIYEPVRFLTEFVSQLVTDPPFETYSLRQVSNRRFNEMRNRTVY